MEKNTFFTWNTYEIYNTSNDLNENLENENNNKSNKNKTDKKLFNLNEDYFDKKLKFTKEKYTIDLGASIINTENEIICFNKNTINNQANAYFKVDKFLIEDYNKNEIKAKNIFAELNGPRYRVTNVFNYY